MLALALALSLHASPALSVERAVSSVFANDAEATNASAHAAWSIALPLAGYAVDGRRGLYIAGGAWLAYSLVNEFALHGPEDSRERNLDLLSRILPCAAILLFDIVRR